MIEFVGYLLLITVARVLALLPLGCALAIGRSLGSVAFTVLPIRRRVVLGNLRHVFGESKDEREIRRLGREAYRQLLMTVVETLRSFSMKPDRFQAQTEIEQLERLRQLQADGTPLIICSPHAGNFDLLGYTAASLGLEVHAVMKAVEAPRFNDLLVRTREQMGLKVHMSGADTFQELFELLDEGKWVALLPDQRPRKFGVPVEFLGKPAQTFQGPAVLHLVTEAQLVVAVDERLADDPRKHVTHVSFLPPFESTGDRKADIQAITQQMSDAMSQVILRNPGQYFWFHRRWGKRAFLTS